ncbi:MAG TPA: putative cytokinetic ring protein SteA [Actinomycetota bacterium]|nr:putative cytokinetic ring protein SteA [Actinomycetota bacterium]
MIRRLRRLSPPAAPGDGTLSGIARVDRRTKNLLSRLEPGEIAIVDHRDIDRVSAEGLIGRQARAVVNAAPSSSGRYPNLGPLLLCSAGIHVVDDAGPEVMAIGDGARVSIEEDRVFVVTARDTTEVARGRVLTLEQAEKALDVAKQGIAAEIERFAANTMTYIKDERDVLLEATRLPETRTDFHGRHALIVVRGYDYKEDLATLRAYIREMRPILVGVDGGADALLERGLRPDVIIGDMDSVTTEALLTGAELVVHAYPGGAAPGVERLRALGLESVTFEATGTSEDIAMLLAHENGAELIVAVGTHANLIEFLDKGRRGMASTFLTRLRVGSILVDAKGVSRLYRSSLRRMDLAMLIGAALVTLAIAVWLSEPMRIYLDLLWVQIKNLWFSIKQALF